MITYKYRKYPEKFKVFVSQQFIKWGISIRIGVLLVACAFSCTKIISFHAFENSRGL